MNITKIAVIGLAWLVITVWGSVAQVYSQVAIPTSTPVQIRLASVTPPPAVTSTPVGGSDFDISGETATPRNIVMIEPISEVNVRSSPEITDDNRLGAIQVGQRYTVVGQYFNWLQIQYDLAPDQRAWVYADLVEVVGGDTIDIPTVAADATSTPDPLTDGATQTREAILAEPGGELTVTALSRVISLPEGVVDPGSEGNDIVFSNQTPLPTFTYPPGVLIGVPTLEATRNVQLVAGQDAGAGADGIAPILPIVGLALFGVLGIMITLLR